MIDEDGRREEDDEVFDNESDAQERISYICSCIRQGAKDFNASNPFDYPLDEDEDPAEGVEFEIIETF
jgi:hypothetical protein